MTMPKNLTPEQQEEWKILKRKRATEWQIQNKERAQERKRIWYLNNRELTIKRAAEHKLKKSPPKIKVELSPEQKEIKRKEYMKKYYSENKELIVKRWVENKKIYYENPLFRFKETLRTRVRISLLSRGYTKKSKTFNLIGCDFEYLLNHIESQFESGMSWENQGKWHLDHKVPLCIAKTEDELIKLNHFTNLGPLWAEDNFSKNRKMLDEFINLRIKLLGR